MEVLATLAQAFALLFILFVTLGAVLIAAFLFVLLVAGLLAGNRRDERVSDE